jgi:hypothetical protein
MPVISVIQYVEIRNCSSNPVQAKVNKTLPQKTSWMWWYTPVIPATWEVVIEGSWFKAGLGKTLASPYLKKTSLVWWLMPIIPSAGS